MSSAAGLLFELANVDRLTILTEIDTEPLKLSQVARKLSATVQETSRHLERLSKAKLIEKDSTSSYRITSFGKLILSLLPSFDFSRREERFLSHNLSSLFRKGSHRELGNYPSIGPWSDWMTRLQLLSVS